MTHGSSAQVGTKRENLVMIWILSVPIALLVHNWRFIHLKYVDCYRHIGSIVSNGVFLCEMHTVRMFIRSILKKKLFYRVEFENNTTE